ncbi:MAG: transposase [Lachnospiraceae bacterium]|nr:transposase [Lachnospiraceae bacterium]
MPRSPKRRLRVTYLISDMYTQYLQYVGCYFLMATPAVDSSHVIQWLIRELDKSTRALLNGSKSTTGCVRNSFPWTCTVKSNFKCLTKSTFSRITAGYFSKTRNTLVLFVAKSMTATSSAL